MTNRIVPQNRQGYLAITIRATDDYWNATEIAQFYGKRINNFLRSNRTKTQLAQLSARTGLSIVAKNDNIKSLVEISQGGLAYQGTWMHPEIAKIFQEWCIQSMSTKVLLLSEIAIRDKIAKKLNGITEVPCKTGFVDVLTDKEVIEVKAIKCWKTAIGQSLVYACEWDRKPRIHLFGVASNDYKYMIMSFCSKLNVFVSFED